MYIVCDMIYDILLKYIFGMNTRRKYLYAVCDIINFTYAKIKVWINVFEICFSIIHT